MEAFGNIELTSLFVSLNCVRKQETGQNNRLSFINADFVQLLIFLKSFHRNLVRGWTRILRIITLHNIDIKFKIVFFWCSSLFLSAGTCLRFVFFNNFKNLGILQIFNVYIHVRLFLLFLLDFLNFLVRHRGLIFINQRLCWQLLLCRLWCSLIFVIWLDHRLLEFLT